MTNELENLLSDFVIQFLENDNTLWSCIIHTRLLEEIKQGNLELAILHQLYYNLGIDDSQYPLH